MNACVRVPTKPMIAVEPERHSRLGGGGSSAIRRSMKERKKADASCLLFVFFCKSNSAFSNFAGA